MSTERMMSWNGAGRASARPFLIQYLTLMLIILSFMVGSFATRALGPAPVPVKQLEQKPTRHAIETFTIQDFYANGSTEAGEGKLEALQALFTSHDLSAEITSFADASTGQQSSTSQALGRAFEIKRSLEIGGIPASSIKTFASAHATGSHIEITLYTDRRGASDE